MDTVSRPAFPTDLRATASKRKVVRMVDQQFSPNSSGVDAASWASSSMKHST